MNDFNKPIRPITRKDKDRINAESIIHNFKQEEELLELNNKKSDKKTYILSYLELVRNFFSSLFEKKRTSSEVLEDTPLYSTISVIKKCFETIRDTNPNNNLPFAQSFAKTWIALLEVGSMESLKQSPLIAKHVHALINALLHFPPSEKHSLGFYLSGCAENAWFPVPFFVLLLQLHEEHKELNKESHLYTWIRLAEDILSLAKNV